MEACNDAECGADAQCGLIGFGCGLSDVRRYGEGGTPCAECHEANCCTEGLDCARSMACLVYLDCVFSCLGQEPDCPARPCAELFPEGKPLADRWAECLPVCNSVCP